MNRELERGRLVTSHAGSLLGLALLLVSTMVEATAFSIADGNWSAAATWSGTNCGAAAGGGIPAANETVVICNGTSVTVNGTQTAQVVFINAGGALLGGSGRLVLQGSPAIHRSGTGSFIPGTGTVAMTGNAAVTVATATAAAASVMTFNNLELSPTMSASRTYTLGAGQVGQLIVNGDFVILPFDNTAAASRILTVNDGTLNAATVVGMLRLDIRAGAASDDVVTFNAGGIPWSAGRINIGGTGAGAKTFVAGASTITLNGSTSPLLTRGTGGNFSAGTSTVLVSAAASTTLNSGTFSSAHAFNLLTINVPGQTVTLSGTANDDVTVNSNLRMTGGTLNVGDRVMRVGGAASIGAATTLTAAGTSSLRVTGNWVNAGAFSAGTTGTVTLDGAAAQLLIGTTTFANLTSSNTNASGVTLSGTTSTVVVNSTLTLGAAPFIVGGNSLVLNGPTIAGTPTNLSAGATSNLTFGGNTAGVNLPSNISSLNQLSVGNSVAAQSALTLNNSLTVANRLTLNTGVIDAGLNLLTVSANCTTGVVRNGTTSLGWVEGDVRLTFPGGAATCIFPVGDAANVAGAAYAGMQLAFAAGATAGTLTAAVTKEDHRNTTAGTSGILPTTSVNRYWTLKDSGVAGTYTAVFSYASTDNDGVDASAYTGRRGSNCVGTGVARNCTPWGSLTVSSPSLTSITASGITITADSPLQADFSFGNADPSTNFQREKQFIYTRELY